MVWAYLHYIFVLSSHPKFGSSAMQKTVNSWRLWLQSVWMVDEIITFNINISSQVYTGSLSILEDTKIRLLDLNVHLWRKHIGLLPIIIYYGMSAIFASRVYMQLQKHPPTQHLLKI